MGLFIYLTNLTIVCYSLLIILVNLFIIDKDNECAHSVGKWILDIFTTSRKLTQSEAQSNAVDIDDSGEDDGGSGHNIAT